MVKRMLIDASHAEETRVVVANGTRLEEFDFESAARRQLKGNIYLAKVMRVEPSLQAAFVDYGGNRHGFLPFSEIHPDYYQIPVADREALFREQEEAPDIDESEEDDDDTEELDSDVESESDDLDDEDNGDADNADAELDDDSEDNGDEDNGAELDDDENGEAASIDEDENPTEADSADGSDTQDNADEEAPEQAAADEGDSDEADADSAEPAADADAEENAESGASASDADASDAEGDGEDGKPRNVAADAAAPSVSSAPRGRGRGRRRKRKGKSESVEEIGGDEIEDIERRRSRASRSLLSHRYRIQEVIKKRQILLVQVVKEERGNKGAALTSYLSLAGRYCVLMPNAVRGGGISRKITSQEDRKRLKSILAEMEVPARMGVIVRTAGTARSKAEIKRDFEYLMRQWEKIREQTLNSIAPALIYEEGNLIKRSIRDLYIRDVDQILVDGEEGYRVAKDFMRMLIPSHSAKVQPYRDRIPLFSRYQIESQLDSMYSPEVQLKSGGYLVINSTEALVAIDVNSGRATRERNIEETAVKTNLEAASEVARQLRLRDLAGLIVVDFIDMEENRNQRAVERKLKEAMRADRARIQIGRISPFGLLEMSRQRLRPSLTEASMETCSSCGGAGIVRSIGSSAVHVLRAIEEEGLRNRSAEIRVHVPARVAYYVLNKKRKALAEIEERCNFEVDFAEDEALVPPMYNIERLRARDGEIEDEENAAPAPDASEATDSSGEPKKRRRRRRGRRKSESENGDSQETAADEDQQADAESSGTEDDAEREGDGEATPRKRRRRGKRGGRRRSSRKTAAAGEEAAESESAEPAEDAADSETPSENETQEAAADSESDADSAEAPEETETKSRRRRSRTRSPKKAAETEAASEPVGDDTADAEDAAQPAAAAKTAEDQAEDTASGDTANAADTADEPENSSGEAAETAEEPAPAPRRGWWQRKSASAGDD